MKHIFLATLFLISGFTLFASGVTKDKTGITYDTGNGFIRLQVFPKM